jgi:hypothetical protein
MPKDLSGRVYSKINLRPWPAVGEYWRFKPNAAEIILFPKGWENKFHPVIKVRPRPRNWNELEVDFNNFSVYMFSHNRNRWGKKSFICPACSKPYFDVFDYLCSRCR